MTTQSQLVAWLKGASARRCILVEVVVNVAGTDITRYLSNVGYVTSPSDTPANTSYSPIISGSVSFSESVKLDNSYGISYGDIELFNESGVRDAWLNDVWSNRSIKVFIGDMSWTRSQFYQIFSGTVFSINSSQENRLNIKLGDKLQLLNTQISNVLLGGASANKNKLIPLTFGEVFNVTPLLKDSNVLEFKINNGPIELIIEIRDNGTPVYNSALPSGATVDLTTGEFTLANAPYGTVTCSIQGDKPSAYVNDIASTIKRLVKSFGVTPFTDADIDLSNFSTFAAAHTQAIGIYLDQPANVLETIQTLASSIGAHVLMDRNGLLKLVQIAFPATGATTNITARDMLFKTFRISNRYGVQAGQLLSYCVNYTNQTDILTGIPESNKALYSQDVQYVSSNDPAIATLYKLTTIPVAQPTNLINATEAQIECNRRLNIFNVQRTSYTFIGLSHLLVLNLGDVVNITNPRFGFVSGLNCVVTALDTDWIAGTVKVEVTV